MASFSTNSNHDYNPDRGNDYDPMVRKLDCIMWSLSATVRKLTSTINAWRNSNSNTTLDRW